MTNIISFTQWINDPSAELSERAENHRIDAKINLRHEERRQNVERESESESVAVVTPKRKRKTVNG